MAIRICWAHTARHFAVGFAGRSMASSDRVYDGEAWVSILSEPTKHDLDVSGYREAELKMGEVMREIVYTRQPEETDKRHIKNSQMPQPVSCQETTTTLTASVPDGTTKLQRQQQHSNRTVGRQEKESEERRHTRHNTQHTTQTDRSTQSLLLLPKHSAATSRGQFAESAKGGGRGKQKRQDRRHDSGGGGQRAGGTEAARRVPPDGHTKEETLSWWGGELFDE